jgi:hypothetical protein
LSIIILPFSFPTNLRADKARNSRRCDVLQSDIDTNQPPHPPGAPMSDPGFAENLERAQHAVADLWGCL